MKQNIREIWLDLSSAIADIMAEMRDFMFRLDLPLVQQRRTWVESSTELGQKNKFSVPNRFKSPALEYG